MLCNCSLYGFSFAPFQYFEALFVSEVNVYCEFWYVESHLIKWLCHTCDHGELKCATGLPAMPDINGKNMESFTN